MINDFTLHNQMVDKLWDDFSKGNPERVPVIAGVSSRYIILDKFAVYQGITFEEYHSNPEAMLAVQLELERFRRLEIDDDTTKGIPEEGWSVGVDFQNVYEAAWFGAQVVFPKDNVPDTIPFLDDSNKYAFVKQPLPDPFSGIMGQAREYIEYFKKQAEKMTYMGKPITGFGGCPIWTDGPFTVACNIRGTENFCLDMISEPDYAERLLDYITNATIQRVKVWRQYLGLPVKIPGTGFADDIIQILSIDMVKKYLLPRYRRMIDELSTPDSQPGIHLCGDATRLMPMLRDELNAGHFDTGFPVDFADFSKKIGPDVIWQGGPHVALLLHGKPEAIKKETKRILDEVMPNTKKFVLRDGNDIAPHTPLENIQAMVDAGREYGVYEKTKEFHHD